MELRLQVPLQLDGRFMTTATRAFEVVATVPGAADVELASGGPQSAAVGRCGDDAAPSTSSSDAAASVGSGGGDAAASGGGGGGGDGLLAGGLVVVVPSAGELAALMAALHAAFPALALAGYVRSLDEGALLLATRPPRALGIAALGRGVPVRACAHALRLCAPRVHPYFELS